MTTRRPHTPPSTPLARFPSCQCKTPRCTCLSYPHPPTLVLCSFPSVLAAFRYFRSASSHAYILIPPRTVRICTVLRLFIRSHTATLFLCCIHTSLRGPFDVYSVPSCATPLHSPLHTLFAFAFVASSRIHSCLPPRIIIVLLFDRSSTFSGDAHEGMDTAFIGWARCHSVVTNYRRLVYYSILGYSHHASSQYKNT